MSNPITKWLRGRRERAEGLVLVAFLSDPGACRFGYDLMQTLGFGSGKLYPILARFERDGWLETGFEDVNPHVAKRPARRWYRLTEQGKAAAAQRYGQFTT